MVADQREFIFEAIAEALAAFYDDAIVKLICEPYEKRFRELTATIDTLRAEIRVRRGDFEPIDLPPLEFSRRPQ